MSQPLSIKLEESQCSELASSDGNNDDTVECKSSSFSSTYYDGTLLYSLRQKPSIVISTFLAVQVIIVITFSVIWLPLTLTKSLCIHPDDPARVEIISLSMFSSGLSTALFSTIGLRLPVLLIPSAQYMNSLKNILKIPELKCLGAGDLYAMGPENRTLEWQNRLKYLQGGILMTSFLQLLFGITGISGLFDTLLSNPLILIPTTIIIGFSYANQVMNLTIDSDIFTEIYDAMPWGIIILTVGILIIAGLKFQHLEFKLPSYTHEEGFSTSYLKLFRMFAVLFASFFVLIIYPCLSRIINGKNEDENIFMEQSFENSRSYYIHLPFSYGWPSFHSDAFLYLLPAAIIQMIQSILIYRVTNFIYGQNIKRNYINKGISMEGFVSFIAGIFGMTTVASPINIGIMQLTGVGSRWVTQLSGIFLIFFSIPASFVGFLVRVSPLFILTTLFIISAIISVTGLSMMQRINMNSFRSCTIIGLSLYAGIVIPSIIPNINSELRLVQIIIEVISSNLIICMAVASILNSMLPRTEPSDIIHEELEVKKEKEKRGPSFCEECFAICLI